MHEALARELGWETAGQILINLEADDVGFVGVDCAGEIFWRGAGTLDLEVASQIRSWVLDEPPAGTVRVALSDRGWILLAPVELSPDVPVGWLVGWSGSAAAPGGDTATWKRVEETLPRVAAMLSRECALVSELSGAVVELGGRYEELNLVFRMEREARDADPQIETVRTMLKGFVGHLGIDVGLLISRSCGADLGARGTRLEIANLDLVLSELRGKVRRFLSASHKPLIINDLDDDRRAYLLTNLPFKLLAIPNEGCGGPDSVLLLLRHADSPDFTNSDLSLARVFFGQAMVMLRNLSLLAKMAKFTREIASSLVETVEAKDPYTRGHSERVELITSGLAREIGVPDDQHTDLTWGALFHDIGKIGIPDAILMKPSRLTADEYVFIKTHPERSYEILKHIEQLGATALDGARYHQERFDGQGYPFGLAGSEIPLAARIIAVADTYDAVTSSRSYRPAANHEKGMSVVAEVKGAQLDPEIVQVFEELVARDDDWLAAIRPESIEDLDG